MRAVMWARKWSSCFLSIFSCSTWRCCIGSEAAHPCWRRWRLAMVYLYWGEPRDAPWDISITRHPSHDRQDLPAGVPTGCILICLREGFKVAAVGRKLQRIGTHQLIHCRGYFYLLPQVDVVFGVYNRQNRLDYLRWTPNISFFCTFVCFAPVFPMSDKRFDITLF